MSAALAVAPSWPDRRADIDLHAAHHALRWFALGYFVLLTAVSGLMNGPLIHGDEGSYLLNAAALAGKLRSGLGENYYSGYSVLIVPAFLMFVKFSTIFHYTLLLNAALLATLPFALMRIVLGIDASTPPRLAAFAAATASCQTAVLCFSQLALSENLLVPLYAWMLACGCSMARHHSWRAGVLCGALAGALFLTHPRGGMMALPVLLMWSLLLIGERRARAVIVAMWVAALLVAAQHGLLESLAGKTAVTHQGAYSTAMLLGRMASVHTWNSAALNGFGATTYLAIATFGVFTLGVVELAPFVRDAWRRRRAPMSVASSTTLGMLAGLAASLVLTAFFLAPPQRADSVIYGRYTIPALLPVLAFGLTRLHKNGGRPTTTTWMALAITAAAIGIVALAFAVLPLPSTTSWVRINILDLFVPIFLAGRRIDWLCISAYFIIGASSVIALARWRTNAALAFYVVANIAAATFITVTGSLPGTALRARESVADDALHAFETATGVPVCIRIAHELDHWHLVDYRTRLFDRVDESTVVDRSRCVHGVIAPLSKYQSQASTWRLISTDLYNPYGLFIEASPALDAYAAQYALPPVNFPGPIDAAERTHALIALSGIDDRTHLAAGDELTVGVKLTHAGGKVIWPARFDDSGHAAMRVGARVDPLDGGDSHVEFRADLLRSLPPNESTSTELTIGPFEKPGRYRVEIGALQDGIVWFGKTSTVTITVEGK